MERIQREFRRPSLFAFPLISVERSRGKPKANIISHIKRDRPPDVEGARVLRRYRTSM